MVELGICLRNTMPIKTIIDLSRRAEDRGFHSVWITEGSGCKDAITQMAAVAMATSRIKIGSGIIPISTRTPALLGSTFIGLDELSNGRCILGVGSGHIPILRDYHGIRVDKPVGLMREYIQVIRLLFQQERFSYEGKLVKISNYHRRVKPLSAHLPVYVAALNPQMLRLVGEAADGALLNVVTPAYLAAARETIAERARQAGRNPGDIHIGSYVLCTLSDNRREALAVIQEMIAHYAHDPFYETMLRRAGFGATLDRMAEPLRREDYWGAGALIPEDMASAIGMYGDIRRCRETLDSFAEAGLQLAVLHPQLPPGTDPATALSNMIDAFAKAVL